jgi:ketosteroid isomerase-like protein
MVVKRGAAMVVAGVGAARRSVAMIVAAAAFSGCGESSPQSSSEVAPASLMEADREFARQTAARGGEGWAAAFAEDGIMFPQKGRVEGRAAILERMRDAFGPDRPRLTWEPDSATVSGGGDLGYTIGRWASLGSTEDGRDSVLARGNYVSIWRRRPGEPWRVVADIGNSDP